MPIVRANYTQFLLLVPLGVVKHESLLHCKACHLSTCTIFFSFHFSVFFLCCWFTLIFFLSVLLFTSFAKEVSQCQSRYVSDPCGSLPLADSVVLWFCGSVMWQTILFTFTLCTKNYIDLGTSGNVWEIFANLKPKLKYFHQVSEKCSGSSYLDFALILLLRFLYVQTNILADHIY